MITEIQRLGGDGMNAVYAVRRAGKRVATISRHGRNDWIMNSVHYGERLSVHRNLDAARAAAVGRPSYPDAVEAYQAICRRVEQQRRAWMRQQRANDLADTALDMAVGGRGAADKIIIISRSIESFAKDRLDTNERERQWLESHLVNSGATCRSIRRHRESTND
jgi:hypothetical protein